MKTLGKVILIVVGGMLVAAILIFAIIGFIAVKSLDVKVNGLSTSIANLQAAMTPTQDPLIPQMATQIANIAKQEPTSDPMIGQLATQVAQLTDICTAKPVPSVDVSCNDDHPKFGSEQHLPPVGTVGPAIAELYNPDTGFCALVKINSGETLPWPAPKSKVGSWWSAVDQSSLDERWPQHLIEYQAKPGYESCLNFTSVKELLSTP